MNTAVRVRFAPSPTGHLHIGGLRTALFNWLFARHVGGTFLVRIEDTDIERSLPEYVDSILQALSWAGLNSDEPIVFQTQRLAQYRTAIEQLLASGKVYRCFCTAQETQPTGVDLEHTKYSGRCRNRAAQPGDETRPHAIRFALPTTMQTIEIHDQIRGTITFDMNQFDDFIIVRSDGVPLYNFVVVIDDIVMRISHVIRGEDHISNTPKQILLYQALGATIPAFAHLPLILGPSGQRLSKREAATSVWEYKNMGYLPQALNNYLMRLGWAWGDKEIFTKEEAVAAFTLEAVGKSGAIFDSAKLDWINSMYLRSCSTQELYDYLVRTSTPAISDTLRASSYELIEGLINLYKDRVNTTTALASTVIAVLQMRELPTVDEYSRALLEQVTQLVDSTVSYTILDLKDQLQQLCKTHGIKFVAIAHPVRLALTGQSNGPGIAELLYVLGKEESVARLRRMYQQL
ncbi:MAG: glutamate--tRNA ligase [Candidatus Babeliales bacterium]